MQIFYENRHADYLRRPRHHEAHRLIERLCAHWSHKLTVEVEDGLGASTLAKALSADSRYQTAARRLNCQDKATTERMHTWYSVHLNV